VLVVVVVWEPSFFVLALLMVPVFVESVVVVVVVVVAMEPRVVVEVGVFDADSVPVSLRGPESAPRSSLPSSSSS